MDELQVVLDRAEQLALHPRSQNEEASVVLVLHGPEVEFFSKRNYDKYKDAVERMRYYADLGVEFRVCGLAAQDYGYTQADFYDFIKVTPSAITELAHWQLQGYALITPQVMEKKFSIEEIR